jgi:hypothetical protein
MELNDDILVQTTSLQTIARIKRVARPGLASFCAYLHGMYDFTRLIQAIVCRKIDLC